MTAIPKFQFAITKLVCNVQVPKIVNLKLRFAMIQFVFNVSQVRTAILLNLFVKTLYASNAQLTIIVKLRLLSVIILIVLNAEQKMTVRNLHQFVRIQFACNALEMMTVMR